MKKNLLKLCLFCSIIGLVILFVGVQQMEAKTIHIGEMEILPERIYM